MQSAAMSVSGNVSQRRARDSNPQLLAQHLISNQTPDHSDTLRGTLCQDPLGNQGLLPGCHGKIFSTRPLWGLDWGGRDIYRGRDARPTANTSIAQRIGHPMR